MVIISTDTEYSGANLGSWEEEIKNSFRGEERSRGNSRKVSSTDFLKLNSEELAERRKKCSRRLDLVWEVM